MKWYFNIKRRVLKKHLKGIISNGGQEIPFALWEQFLEEVNQLSSGDEIPNPYTGKTSTIDSIIFERRAILSGNYIDEFIIECTDGYLIYDAPSLCREYLKCE